MKTLMVILILSLTACKSSGGGSDAGSPQVSSAEPVATASPTPTPTPTPIPTPSPTPTPTPAPAWGGFSGAGDIGHPYQVTTSIDVTHIQDFPAAYFELTGNIDMTGINFTPIATFSGVIQGHLYRLNHFDIETTGGAPAAFAINISGIIHQLYLDNVTLSSDTGYAAGYAYTLTGTATLSQCQILSGTIMSPLGGNGWTTGTGNPFWVNRLAGSTVTQLQSTVDFNGNNSFDTF